MAPMGCNVVLVSTSLEVLSISLVVLMSDQFEDIMLKPQPATISFTKINVPNAWC